MALKDWNYRILTPNVYQHKKKNMELVIKEEFWTSIRTDYIVHVYGFASGERHTWENRKFKSKSQALKFAKQYMRTH